MNKKLQQKINFLISIYGLDTPKKIEGIFGQYPGQNNTSCHICKFYSIAGSCVLKFSERTHWIDRFGQEWCITWLDPKNRKI